MQLVGWLWRLGVPLCYPTDGDTGTIGLQMSTKRRGEISAKCLCGTDQQDDAVCPNGQADKDCSADLDEVTSHYKDPEPSNPGAPHLPLCLVGQDSQGHTVCAGPSIHQADHPTTVSSSRRSHALQSDVSAIGFGEGVAVFPHGAVIITDGHHYSELRMRLLIHNTGTASMHVGCSFNVTVTDYRGVAMGVAGTRDMATSVAEGAEVSFEYGVGRNDYLSFLGPESQAHTLTIDVSCSDEAEQTLFDHVIHRLICTPRSVPRTSGPALTVCNNGLWIPPGMAKAVAEAGGGWRYSSSGDGMLAPQRGVAPRGAFGGGSRGRSAVAAVAAAAAAAGCAMVALTAARRRRGGAAPAADGEACGAYAEMTDGPLASPSMAASTLNVQHNSGAKCDDIDV